MDRLRWGILGAAGIVCSNWKALVHSGNNVVTALAARDRERAEEFLAARQDEWAFEPAPQVLDDYEAVITSPEVDAVYIPLPTGVRKEWVLRAAAAGKHVLAEKPCAVHADDLREMLAACRENGVQFMDGVMFMHNPRLREMEELLAEDGRIGPVRRVTSAFCFPGGEDFGGNIRVKADLEPAGCLGDLGWYCLRWSLFVRRWELPESVTGRIVTTAEDGRTPTEFTGELLWKDGASSAFFCSFRTAPQQWADVCGERGSLSLPDFVHPHNSYEPAYRINTVEHRVAAAVDTIAPFRPGALSDTGHPTAQDTRMFRAFARQVQSAELDPFWPEVALKTQLVMDACLAAARSGTAQVVGTGRS